MIDASRGSVVGNPDLTLREEDVGWLEVSVYYFLLGNMKVYEDEGIIYILHHAEIGFLSIFGGRSPSSFRMWSAHRCRSLSADRSHKAP